jgi:photosystem II stability/assembly factor-like uncharacterized protein
VPGEVSSLASVDFADERHGLITGGSDDGRLILFTDDGGSTWAVASVPPGRHSVRNAVLLDQKRGFAVAEDDGLLATVDGGRTWEIRLRDAEDCCLWGVFFLDGQRGWTVGGGIHGQVYGTTDGGATWRHLAALPGPSLQAVSFADAEHGFAVANQRPCLYLTTDGGVSWRGRRFDGGGECMN